MADDGKFEYILVGPDGRSKLGESPLVKGAVPDDLIIPDKDKNGPWVLKSRYVRTDHKIGGRIRFDWFGSDLQDSGKTYRLASVDGLGGYFENDDE